MDFAKVNVDVRTQTGKGVARRTRATGKVPAILYGHKETPVPLSLDPGALLKSLDKDRKRNTVFTLAVANGEKSEQVTAMIRDFQIHPISRKLVHVDFIRISMDEEINVTVPLILIGMPIGVIDGGNLHASIHALALAAKPGAIPTKIEIDVSTLKIGDALHVSDLKLPAGVRSLLPPKEAVASVVAPRAEKVEVAVTPVEGAVPAEGAAAATAGAAAAPAAAGDKAAAPGKKDDKKKDDKKK